MLRGALNSGPVAGKLWRPQEEVASKASGGTLWEENRASVVTEQEKGKPSRRNYIREPPSSLAHSQRSGSGDVLPATLESQSRTSHEDYETGSLSLVIIPQGSQGHRLEASHEVVPQEDWR